MKEEETIELLRHYRHDWMNQVQLLMGYASMGKIDKVQDKLHECVKSAETERKLQDLGLPKTAIWIISFNWRYDNFRIESRVDVENKNLLPKDDQLHSQLESLIFLLTSYGMKMELYNGTITIHQQKQQRAKIEVSFSGIFEQIERLKQELLEKNEIHTIKIEPLSNEKYRCTITWICN